MKRQLLLLRVSLLTVLVILCGFYRWNKGLHYRELFVRVSGDPSLASTAELFAVLPDGRLSLLQQFQAVDHLWLFQNSEPVSGIVAAWTHPVSSSDISFEIRSGGSWTDDALTLQSRVVQKLDPVDARIRAGLDRRGRVGRIVVLPEACAGSILSSNRGIVNWGGDVYFVAVVLVQAFFGGLFIEFSLRVLRAASRNYSSDYGLAIKESRFWSFLSQAARAAALLLLLIQFRTAIEQLLQARDALQYLTGSLIVGAFAVLYWVWTCWVWRTTSKRRLVLGMLGVSGVILILKVAWLQTAVNAGQSDDYAHYYKIGQQISAGDWDSIGPKHLPLTHIFMRRAWCFSYPITALFGAKISTFEYSNAACQLLSAAIMSLLVHRIWGLHTAARFLPLVFFVPEFWYSAGLVSHNVWGYLWIPLVWLATDIFLVWTNTTVRSQRLGLAQVGWTVVAGGTVGLGVGMVDLLKHYGPFFLMAIFMVVIFGKKLVHSPGQNPGGAASAGRMLRLLFLVTVIVTSIGFWSRVDAFLNSRSGVTRGTFTASMARLAATETGSSTITTNMTIWINQFYMRLPPNYQLPLQVRKALHEHVASGLRLWQQYYFKAQLMSVQTYAMTMVHNKSTATRNVSMRLVPWSTVQYTVVWTVSAMLLTTGILRLLVISVVPISSRELFPMLSVIFVMAASFALTDAHPYTGQNLAFPLCCAMAVLPNCRQSAQRGGNAGWRQIPGLLQVRKLLLGFALFGTLIAVHAGLGTVVDHSGLTFHRITTVPPDPAMAASETVNIDPAGVRLIASRIHAGISLVPLNRHVSRGVRVVRHFRVTADRGKLNGLKFLMTGNPREFVNGWYSSRSEALRNVWKDLPIRYSVAIEGREVASGPLFDLARVRIAEYPAEFWRGQEPPSSSIVPENSAVITLTLESDADMDLGNRPWPPSLAVEFFH